MDAKIESMLWRLITFVLAAILWTVACSTEEDRRGGDVPNDTLDLVSDPARDESTDAEGVEFHEDVRANT